MKLLLSLLIILIFASNAEALQVFGGDPLTTSGDLIVGGKLNVTGGFRAAFRNVSTNNSPVAVTTNDYSFDCNAAAGDVTFNLMSSSLVPGQGFEFSNIGASGKCKIEAAGSEKISGFDNYSGLDTQWESCLIRSNGTGWTIKACY